MNVEFKEAIQMIVRLIHSYNDYKEAARIMREYNISLLQLTQNTMKLNIRDIAKLADEIINQ